jgi:hypothetical protein
VANNNSSSSFVRSITSCEVLVAGSNTGRTGTGVGVGVGVGVGGSNGNSECGGDGSDDCDNDDVDDETGNNGGDGGAEEDKSPLNTGPENFNVCLENKQQKSKSNPKSYRNKWLS